VSDEKGRELKCGDMQRYDICRTSRVTGRRSVPGRWR
jgi:hypothetical protein